MASLLDCYTLRGGVGDRCCYRRLPCPSFSAVCLCSSTPLPNSFLALSVIVSGDSTDNEHAPPLPSSHCSRTTDPDKAFRGNLDHKNHHDLRCRPLRSVRSLVAARPIDVKVTLGYSTDPRSFHIPLSLWLPVGHSWAVAGLAGSL